MPDGDNGTLMKVFTDEVKAKAEEFMDAFRARMGNMTLAELLAEFYFFMSSKGLNSKIGGLGSGQSSEIMVMEVEEFMKSGLLQEVNRQFLHPRGLAMEVREDEGPNGEKFYSFGRIWDYRSDPEGIVFGEGVLDTPEARSKADRVQRMFLAKRDVRIKSLGWPVQPIPGSEGSDGQEET